MRSGASVVAVVLLLTAVGSVPHAGADCPQPPKDCGSFIDVINFGMDDSSISLGAYKDDVQETQEDLEENTETSEARWLVLQDDGSFRPMAHANGTSGETLDTGDHGGILVVVEEVGGASSFTLTFTETTGGIVWDSDGSITIPSPEDDGHYLIPFTVISSGKDLTFDYKVKDDRSNQADGTMRVPIDGKDISWGLYVLVVLILLILVVVLMVSKRPPSSTTAPSSGDPGSTDTSIPPGDAGDGGDDDSSTGPLNQ